MAFDLPNVERLADHLLGQIAGMLPRGSRSLAPRGPSSADLPPSPGRPPQRLASLYRRVCEAGQPVAAMHLLTSASYALPTFGPEDSWVSTLSPRRLASGPGGPALVCFPTFLPAAGASNSRPASTLSGTLRGRAPRRGRLRRGARRLGDARAHARRDRAPGVRRPAVVLVGYSAGGCVAAAVAGEMTASESRLRASSWWIATVSPTRTTTRTGCCRCPPYGFRGSARGSRTSPTIPPWRRWARTCGSSGTGGHARGRADAVPPGERSVAGGAARAVRRGLAQSRPYDVTDVPGNHLELIDSRARTTAEAIRAWLVSAPG